MPDQPVKATPDPEQQQVIEEIVNALWERFPKRYARKLLQGNEGLVSLDTLTSTAMRRLVNAFQSKDHASLVELRDDLKRAMGYLKVTMRTAVIKKVQSLTKLPTQPLGEFDPEAKQSEDRLEKFTFAMLSQRELLGAGDRAILEMRDDRQLDYDEIFVQERWDLVKDDCPREELDLLNPIFERREVVGDRSPEFKAAVRQALARLKSRGHDFSKECRDELYARYEKARVRLQKRLEDWLQREFLD